MATEETVQERLAAAETEAELLWRQFADQLDALIVTGDELLRLSQSVGNTGNLARYYTSVPNALLLEYPPKALQVELRRWHVLKPKTV